MDREALDTDGTPDRGPAVFAVTTATLALATLFVAGRIVSRVGIVRRTGWDDYVMVLAWLLAAGLSLSIDLGAKHGLGQLDEDIEPAELAALRRWEYVFSVLYNPALMATKTSILIFYLRLSKNTQKVFRLASWAVLGIVNVAGTILTFMNIFQCEPTRAAWDIRVQPVRCLPLLTEFICSAPVNITTDLAILALPIPVLTSMRLPPRQKTILVVTFALGIFVTIVDVIRIYYLQQAVDHVPTTASSDRGSMFGQSAGFSWNASLSLMWSAVEVNTGIICACVPTLKPLVIRILPAMLVDPDGTRRSSTRTRTASNVTSTDRRASTLARGSSSLPSPPPPALSLTPPGDDNETERTLGTAAADISIRDFLASSPSNPASRRHSTHTSSVIGKEEGTGTGTGTGQGTAFDFITLPGAKSLLSTPRRQALHYNALASILFFLWGFSYGLLNTLNNTVAAVTHMSRAQTISLTAVYFGGGYLLGPAVVGGWLLRHDEHHRLRDFWGGGGGDNNNQGGEGTERKRGRERKKGGGEKKEKEKEKEKGGDGRKKGVVNGVKRRRRKKGGDEDSVGGFKATIMAGLLIYGVGTIMFWPGAVVGAYGGFMASSFVVGFGLAVLETAANPFLVLCGPPEYADARLLLAQGVQAVGSVLSGLLADRIFFVARLEGDRGTLNSTTLVDVQWTYLAVTLLSVLLALFFYYVPLPEASDAELAELAARSPVDPQQKSVGGISLRTWTVGLAVLAQWCYVSAQENMSLFFEQLVTAFVPNPSAALASSQTGIRPAALALSLPSYLLVAHSTFALSRFLAGGMCILSARHPSNPFLPTARTLLALSITLSTVFVLITVTLPTTNTDPNKAIIPILLFFFAEGPIWPLVFSLGLRGQGARTKQAAAWITMGGCGPGVWPFVSYGIMRRGGSVQVSLVVVVVLMAVAGVYPAFLGFVKGARVLADVPPTTGEDDHGRRRESGGGGGDVESGGGGKGGKSVMVEGKDSGSGLLGEQLRPGWPGRASLSPDAVSNRSSNDQGEGSQQRAPWESQVLDTTILQD
ncbi:hypothetical protein C8A01DRAFT_47302 [Parachaetomium inaequale]|uniref:Rhodopsin domain-containing protein n=1 Tax=Parachaetomium inaequale TaxID=2588326 RepID=A0AAN6PHN0_9PEZI|nr:hypothetical protein C8A01DRAFT_47302 [Parachaetomium inaequale]